MAHVLADKEKKLLPRQAEAPGRGPEMLSGKVGGFEPVLLKKKK